MIQAIAIQALPDFKLQIKFNDGVEGIVELSRLKNGDAFKCWLEPGSFEKAYIDGEGIAWNENLDIDVLSLYLEITGQTFEQFAKKLNIVHMS
jgi:hypothetical protein